MNFDDKRWHIVESWFKEYFKVKVGNRCNKKRRFYFIYTKEIKMRLEVILENAVYPHGKIVVTWFNRSDGTEIGCVEIKCLKTAIKTLYDSCTDKNFIDDVFTKGNYEYGQTTNAFVGIELPGNKVRYIYLGSCNNFDELRKTYNTSKQWEEILDHGDIYFLGNKLDHKPKKEWSRDNCSVFHHRDLGQSIEEASAQIITIKEFEQLSAYYIFMLDLKNQWKVFNKRDNGVQLKEWAPLEPDYFTNFKNIYADTEFMFGYFNSVKFAKYFKRRHNVIVDKIKKLKATFKDDFMFYEDTYIYKGRTYPCYYINIIGLYLLVSTLNDDLGRVDRFMKAIYEKYSEKTSIYIWYNDFVPLKYNLNNEDCLIAVIRHISPIIDKNYDNYTSEAKQYLLGIIEPLLKIYKTKDYDIQTNTELLEQLSKDVLNYMDSFSPLYKTDLPKEKLIVFVDSENPKEIFLNRSKNEFWNNNNNKYGIYDDSFENELYTQYLLEEITKHITIDKRIIKVLYFPTNEMVNVITESHKNSLELKYKGFHVWAGNIEEMYKSYNNMRSWVDNLKDHYGVSLIIGEDTYSLDLWYNEVHCCIDKECRVYINDICVYDPTYFEDYNEDFLQICERVVDNLRQSQKYLSNSVQQIAIGFRFWGDDFKDLMEKVYEIKK